MQSAIDNPAPQISNFQCLSNEFTLAADWLRIPYGDHPHAQAIQRLTRASAEAMVANFKSFSARLGRLFGGMPIYIGHPDDPNLANQFNDKKAYGWIMDLQARDDGLYLAPKWSRAGEDLLANAHYKWFSPFWGCRPISSISNPQSAIRNSVVEPVRLISLGLTNSPNIQGIMPLANEDPPALHSPLGVAGSNPPDPSDVPGVASQAKTGQNKTPKGVSKPMKEALIKQLALANDATDEQILAAVTAIKTAKDASEVALTKESVARTTAENALANERTERTAKEAELLSLANAAQAQTAAQKKARIELILDNAQAAGKITPAQRPQWAADLEKDLDAKLVELANAKPAMHVAPLTQNLGARNASAQANRDATTRRDKVILLVNERMDKTGEGYEVAFANIKKENTALFAEMQTPAKK